jgi:diadenosine tetraphosphatase ApaH/serine/threonine PP2A family protein phosphatase
MNKELPAKIAIISDLHANFEALQQVLADIERLAIEKIISLGDLVGYGPDPEKTARLIWDRHIPVVMGNHELALAGGNYLRRLNESTQESIAITKTLLSPSVRRYLLSLPPTLVIDGIRFVHGCPPDSIETYLFYPEASRLRRIFSLFEERLCFFGHTHQLEVFEYDPVSTKILFTELKPGLFQLSEEKRYLINVGSVGQPRDGINNFAKYIVYDRENSVIEVRAVPYDVENTARKIINLGFPKFNAQRLLQ